MKITVTEAMFKDQFKAYGREENFSNAGLSALFEYCEDMEQDIGEEWELDVIALCCEFTEEHYSDISDNYGIDISGFEGDEEEDFSAVLDCLEMNTSVIYSNEYTGLILYQDF